MVKVWLNASCTEIPIADVISKGLPQFFSDISVGHSEYANLTSFDNFRLYYNANELKEEDLKTITDDDSLIVFVLPEIYKPTETFCKEVEEGIDALTEPLRNPEDRRVNGFNFEFGLPDHVSKVLDNHPVLCHDPRLLTILKDWPLFRAYIVNNDYKEDADRNDFKFSNPHYFSAVKRLLVTIGATYGIRYIERPPVENSAAPTPITQEFLQNALRAALSGARLPGIPSQQAPAQPIHFPPSSAPGTSTSQAPPPAPAESMEQGYEEQVALIRSFGFENDELIQLALEQTNGDVQAAVEFLVEMND